MGRDAKLDAGVATVEIFYVVYSDDRPTVLYETGTVLEGASNKNNC